MNDSPALDPKLIARLRTQAEQAAAHAETELDRAYSSLAAARTAAEAAETAIAGAADRLAIAARDLRWLNDWSAARDEDASAASTGDVVSHEMFPGVREAAEVLGDDPRQTGGPDTSIPDDGLHSYR